MKRLRLAVYCAILTYTSMAQTFMRPNEWKKYKREVFVTAGASNFLGDLGGGNQEGTRFGPSDLDWDQTRVALGFGARYKLSRFINVAGKFSYLAVRGNDAATEDIYRKNRNLNFRSSIFELSGRMEIGYQSTRRGGNRYGIRKNYGKGKNFTHNIFAFAGLGGFYFNPKGVDASGKIHKLRPLHTEGQGLPGGPKQYSNVNISIPMGFYYKLTINKVWSVGLEFAHRKTFTDYIDDVSTVYYDPVALTQAYGPLSAAMADPSLGLIPGASSPAADGTPAQRGDSDKDSFMSLEISVSYIFKKQRKSARLRSKF
ncbi:MAG: hypothetical protein MUF75_03680 [Bacteroidia bacterium]|jgi:hypothetical protein|nr:hypothetical protein [Bacteroidia bacterium]